MGDWNCYAVVKDGASYKFSMWHPTLDLAQAEAMRLSAIERCRFFVVKIVGVVELSTPPIVWTVVE
jgi:hypothetical protein